MMPVKKIELRNLILALFTVFALFGCSRKTCGGTNTIKLIEDILADTSSVRYSLVNGFDEHYTKGKIAVIAPQARTAALVKYLTTCDVFNNIDGTKNPDGLPDFSGETILCMPEIKNVPDTTLDKVGMRELIVIQVLDGVQHGAKVVILAPELAATGLEDVDYLFESLGKDLPIIAMPVFEGDSTNVKSDSAVAEYCYNLLRRKNLFSHNIAYPKEEWVNIDSSDVQD